MIILNCSQHLFQPEDFDFFVEKIIGCGLFSLVKKDTIQDLFPEITESEWNSREFVLIPFHGKNEEVQLATLTVMNLVFKRTGSIPTILFPTLETAINFYCKGV